MLSSDGEQSWLHVPGPRSTIILGVAQLKEVDWHSKFQISFGDGISSQITPAITAAMTEDTMQLSLMTTLGKKAKASHTRHRALGPELIMVYKQSACRWP